jgi:DNA adenine methylase
MQSTIKDLRVNDIISVDIICDRSDNDDALHEPDDIVSQTIEVSITGIRKILGEIREIYISCKDIQLECCSTEEVEAKIKDASISVRKQFITLQFHRLDDNDLWYFFSNKVNITKLPKMKKKIEPALKQVGGKRLLVPKILQYWDPNKDSRLVELFVGGMSVALGLSPKKALLNDANRHLINFHRHVQSGLTIDIEMQNDEKFFYERRIEFNQLIVDGKCQTNRAAQLWYYLNRTDYNGLSRFSGGKRLNKPEKFNAPFGDYKKINYATDFLQFKEVLKNWEFTSGDFATLKLDDEDFIYADPPYYDTFTKYCVDDFSWEDQIRLVEYLSAHPGKVIASNLASPKILDLYSSCGFTVETIQAANRISCTGDRTPMQEMFATKGF